MKVVSHKHSYWLLLFIISLSSFSSIEGAEIKATIPVHASPTHFLLSWPESDQIVCADSTVKKILQETLTLLQKENGALNTTTNKLTEKAFKDVLIAKLAEKGFRADGEKGPGDLLILTVNASTLNASQPLAFRVISSLMLSVPPFRCTLGELSSNTEVKKWLERIGMPELAVIPYDLRNTPVSFVPSSEYQWEQLKPGNQGEISRVFQLAALPLAGASDIKRLGIDRAWQQRDEISQSLPVVSSCLNAGFSTLPTGASHIYFDVWPPESNPAQYSLLTFLDINPPQHSIAEVTHFYYGAGPPHKFETLKEVVGEADEKRVREQITQLTEKANEQLDHSVLKNEFLSKDEIRELRRQLGRVPHVAQVGIVQYKDPHQNMELLQANIIFQPTTYQLTASLSYGSPDGLKPALSYESTNIFSPDDHLSLTVAGGPATYSAVAGYQDRIYRSLDGAWSLNIGPHAGFNQLSKILFGNPDGPYSQKDTVTAGSQISLVFSSSAREVESDSLASPKAGSKPKPIVNEMGSLSLDAYYQSVWLHGSPAVIGPQDHEGGPCLTASGSWLKQWPFAAEAKPWSQLDLSAGGNFSLYGDTQGTDTIHTVTTSSLSSTLYFGWKNPKHFFVRGLVGGGYASNNTPRFDYLSLGGDQIDRGLYAGDVIGRSTLYETLEAACSIGAFLNGELIKSINDEDGFDLNAIYIKSLLDHATAWRRPVLPGIRTLPSDSISLGGALEYDQTLDGRPVDLSIGYAWSPQTDNGGRLFTQISVRF